MKEVPVEEVMREGASLPLPSMSELYRLRAFMRGGLSFVVPIGAEDHPDLIHAWWRNGIGNALCSEVREAAAGGREMRFWLK